jgi:hypothetical protein
MSQINGLNDTAAPWVAPNTGAVGAFPAGSPGNVPWGASSGDAVRPAWFGGNGGTDTGGLDALLGGGSTLMAGGSSLSAILGQLANVVQQYIGRLGNALLGTSTSGNGTGTTGPRGVTAFQNVTLGSTGDPHLSVTGTVEHQDGTTAGVNSHFDSMTAHSDLFSTRDFGDGFNVATTVTQPNANGVTLNASATATMDGGLDSVTMTAGGGVAVTSGGNSIALAAGQSVRLAGGAVVSEAANGSVSIAETNFGQNLTTTFAQNGGGGVDVTATGNNVTLSGDLLTGGSTPVAPPRMRTYSTAAQG